MIVEAEPWQDAFPGGAQWISYANTGIGGDTLAPRLGDVLNQTGQLVVFELLLEYDLSSAGVFNMDLWADDTARIVVDGLLIQAPNIAFVQNGPCADGVIGCEPGEGFTTDTLPGGPGIDWAAGQHTVLMQFYQVGLRQESRPQSLRRVVPNQRPTRTR